MYNIYYSIPLAPEKPRYGRSAYYFPYPCRRCLMVRFNSIGYYACNCSPQHARSPIYYFSIFLCVARFFLHVIYLLGYGVSLLLDVLDCHPDLWNKKIPLQYLQILCLRHLNPRQSYQICIFYCLYPH